MKRFLKIILWVFIAAILIGTFVYLYKNSQTKENEYEIVTPTVGNIEKTTVITGTIEPRDEIEVKPQISGIIEEIMVEAGQSVSVGDIIARIRVVPDESQLSSASARITTAQISLNDATTRHNRNLALFKRGVIAREELEKTQTEVENARAELAAANDAYAIVRNGASPSNAQGANTLVRATASGIVLDVPVKVGASVIQANTFNDGTTIAKIADMRNLIFKGKVDETEVGKLQIGQEMIITIGALPDLSLTSSIEYISPKSDNTSGANAFEIKGTIAVPADVQLRSGYSANAAVTLQRADNVLMLPESLVEFSGDSTFVYITTDTINPVFNRTAVVTGLSDGMNIEIKKGIDKSARVRGQQIQQ